MGVEVHTEPPPADLVIDALIDYSLRGDPADAAPSSSPGRLYLADISIPPPVYRRLAIHAPLVFEGGTTLELTWSNPNSPSVGQ